MQNKAQEGERERKAKWINLEYVWNRERILIKFLQG